MKIKNRKSIHRLLMPVVSIWTALCISAGIAAVAALTNEKVIEGVTVTTKDDCTSVESGVVTVKVSGTDDDGNGCNGDSSSSQNTTITITNALGSAATIYFDWEATNVNELTIDNEKRSETSGNYSNLLSAGGSVEAKITTGKNSTENKLVLRNFRIVAVQTSSTVTLGEYEMTLGTAKVGEGAAATGNMETAVALRASVNTGTTFLGWINADTNKIISTDLSYDYKPVNDITVKPVFVGGATPNACFKVGDYLFEDLKDADDFAKTASSKTILLLNDGSLGAGKTYTISSGVQLLIPYGQSDAGTFGEKPQNFLSENSGKNTPDKRCFAYRTLTVPVGTKIECFGSINVNGQRLDNGQPYTGVVLGGYGRIVLGEISSTVTDDIADEDLQSQLIIKKGGKLFCYGYIIGTGMVEAESESTVHELMQIASWPGGTNASNYLDEGKIFLISQYYIQNIESALKVHYNAILKAEAAIKVQLVGQQSASATYIGTSSNKGLFNLTSGASILRRYDAANDRINYKLEGTTDFGSVDVPLDSWGQTVSSDDYILPIHNSMTIQILNGGKLNVSQKIAILPGAEVIIDEGAEVNLTGQVYIFDAQDWTSSHFFNRGSEMASTLTQDTPNWNPLQYIATTNSTSERNLNKNYGYQASTTTFVIDTQNYEVSGKLRVDGKLTISSTNGGIFTTNKTSPGKTDKVIIGTGEIQHSGTYSVAEIVGGYSGTEQKIAVTGGLGYIIGQDGMQPFVNDGQTYYGYGDNGVDHNLGEEYHQRWHRGVAQIGTTIYPSLQAAMKAYSGGYIQMIYSTAESAFTLDRNITVDLNGCDVDRIVTLGGYTFSGMDSKTDGYASGEEGTIKISGGTVAPVTEFTGKNTTEGNYTVSLHRYLAIKDDTAVDTWTFHRYNLSVGKEYYLEVLSNDTAKIGVSAYFRGDEAVRGKLSEMGFLIGSATTPTATTDVSSVTDPYTLYYTSDAAAMDKTALTPLVTAAVEFTTDTGTYYFSNSRTVDFVTMLENYYKNCDNESAKTILENFAKAAEITLPQT